MTDRVGLPRSYFYQRLANDLLCELTLNREEPETPQKPQPQGGSRQEMVMRVNIQDALRCVKFCPVCGDEIIPNPDHPLYRECECGEFQVSDVWLDGDVSFEFKMFAVNVGSGEEKQDEDDAGRL